MPNNPVHTKEKKGKLLRPAKRKPVPVSGTEEKSVLRLKSGFDWMFASIIIILLVIGTVFVFSSSYVYAEYNYDDSFHFIRKQLGWVILSLGVCFGFTLFGDYLWLKKLAPIAFVASYLLLWSVFFFGADANGARRWAFGVQPSEFVKFTVILMIAYYVIKLEAKDRDRIRSVRYGIIPFALLGIGIAIPLILQPHLSATIIILALIFILMYFAGVKQSYLIGAIVIGAVAMLVIILGTSHGMARIDSWLHPEDNIRDGGWQPLQSLYAIGSGGLFGVGLGKSNQKHLYLPEPQNDYIFSIICEEMGFIFAVGIIVLFLLLIGRGLYIAKNAPSKFTSLVVIGIILQIAIQVFLNIAVVTGSIPSTGVSLPFFSYGGSSLLVFMFEMGVVLNISRFSHTEKS